MRTTHVNAKITKAHFFHGSYLIPSFFVVEPELFSRLGYSLVESETVLIMPQSATFIPNLNEIEKDSRQQLSRHHGTSILVGP